MIDSILVALNKKIFSLAPVDYAKGLASRLKAKVSILIVQDEETETNGEFFLKELQPVLEKYRVNKIPVECYLSKGDFVKEVTKFVEENKANMIVIPRPLQKKDKDFDKWVKSLRRNIQSLLIIVEKK
ncbi:MAG: hypothetical protein LWW94_03485 [Candidatus Desulfofervidaceae bacterium]|nr:hypothetical protein [Candidatus Desulfofervidaceae bacterium]